MKKSQWLSALLLSLSCQLTTAQKLDPTFSPSILRGSGAFLCLVQPDNKLLVTTNSNHFLNDVPVRRFFRLHENGAIDESFQYAAELNSPPRTAQLQDDGKIVVGGKFYDEEGTFLGNMLRLWPDGSLDTAFQTYIDEAFDLTEMKVLPNQKIFTAGYVNTDTGLVYSVFLAAEDGGMDAHFPKIDFTGDRPDRNVHIADLDFQSVNELIVAGSNLQVGDKTHDILRLDSLGVPDVDFNPFFQSVSNFRIRNIGVLPDGTIGILAGDHSNITIVNRDGLTRATYQLSNNRSILHPAGDNSFYIFGEKFYQVFADGLSIGFPDLTANGLIYGMAVQTDDQVVLAGTFSNIGGTFKPGLLRLTPGELGDSPEIDDSFNVGLYTKGTVRDLVVQADGKIVIAGLFHLVDGQRINHVARIEPDGSIDTTFNSSIAPIDRSISKLEQQSNGNLVLAGRYIVPVFDNLFNGIAIIDQDGEQLRNLNFSSTFCNIGCASSISYLAVDSQDRIYAGSNAAYRSNDDSGQDLNRFSADGFLEADYNQSYLRSIRRYNGFEVLSDDKLLLFGHQINYDDSDTTYIIRADVNGQRDSEFQPILTKSLFATTTLSPQPDFTLVAGSTLDENLRTTNAFFYKLDSSGQILEAFDPSIQRADDQPFVISFMSPLPGGGILISGRFNVYDGSEVPNNSVVIDENCQFMANYFPEAQTLSIAAMAPIDDSQYYLSGTFDFGSGRTAMIRVTDDITDVEPPAEAPSRSATIFPNPMTAAVDGLQLRLNGQWSGTEVPFHLIEAATGKIARSGQFVAREINHLDVGDLAAGTYLLRLMHPELEGESLMVVKQ